MIKLMAKKLGIAELSREELKKYCSTNKLDFDDAKPWGAYFNTLESGPCDCVVDDKKYQAFGLKEKVMFVLPGHLLSLQTHKFRSEIWQALTEGVCLMLGPSIDKISKICIPKGAEIEIPKGWFHQLLNDSSHEIAVFEKQIGICFEEDIERHNDPYNR